MKARTNSRFVTALALASAAMSSACSSSEPAEVTDAEPPFATGVDVTFLDRTLNPCDDFYRFACGAWIRERGGQEASRFREGQNRTTYLLQKLVQGSSKEQVDPRVRSTYDSCVQSRTNSIPPRDLDPLLTAVADMTSLAKLPELLGRLHSVGVNAVFNIGALPNPDDPLKNVMWLRPASPSLLAREFYSDQEVQAEFTRHVGALLALHGTTVEPADAAGLETALVLATQDDGNELGELRPLAALQADTQSFDWSAYFSALGISTQVQQVNLVDPEYFSGLEAELSTRSLAEWKSYLRYRIVKSFTGALGAAIIEEEAAFDGKFTGAPEAPDPELACLDDTAGLYAFEFSRAFVKLLFTTQDREKVRQLFERLREAFHKQLQQTSTLDAETRAAALNKLEQVLPQIAFPDEQDWPTTSYPPASANQNYLSSILKLAELRTMAEWTTLGQPAERSKFGMAPIIKNALYAPHSNRVIVPAAFLMRPAYDPARATVANYATVGTVLGHELSHGFDYEGRYFDGTGRLVDWWSDASAQGYEQRTSCLVDQFDAYEPLPGLHVDGSFTLSENIADLNGVKLALAAYKASGARDPELAGFSTEQQFFLSFAQLWCENASEDALKLTVLTDNHSPAQYRVNGVVRNMPEFAEAFACTPGRALVPERRCSVF